MTTKETLEQIYSRLDIVSALEELQPQDKGSYYLVTCPGCKKREAFIYKGSKAIICNRKNECKYKASLWDYVQQKHRINDRETLIELARLAHYELAGIEQIDFQKIEQEKKQSAILETAMSYFQSLVGGNQAYLASRNYTQADIENMGLGYFPGREKTSAYLLSKGYSQEEINSIEAFSEKWEREEYKLVFPYRDNQGQIKTLYGRLTRQLKEGEKESDKYKNFSHCTKEVLFGLEYAWQDVVIVEGFLDCLLAKARDIKNIVGIGGSILAENQIKLAVSHGIKSFTLCLDNDKAGIDGTTASIKKLLAKGLPCFVITIPECKDLDEYLVKFGKESFEELRNQGISGTRWLAESIVRDYDKATDKGKQDCFQALIDLYQKARLLPDKQAVKDALLGTFEKPEIDLFFERIDSQEVLAKTQQATKSELEAMQKEFEATGKLDISLRCENLQGIMINSQVIAARPKQSQEAWLQEIYHKEQEYKGLLGYRLGNDFHPVEKELEGIQSGLYILGAQTNIGKTAFVANLALELIENNADLKVIYFSLDDNKSVIASRMRAIIAFSDTERDLSKAITINEFRKSLVSPKKEKKEQVNARFLEYIKAGRLEIYDIADSPNMKDIELTVRQRANTKIVVVIDGLYNALVSENIAGKREENIERANKIKALVDTYSFPLICTAEVRKKNQVKGEITIDDLMETGKFGYNSNLVWLLKAKDEKNNDEMVTLTLDYAKNKLTGFKGCQEVKYFRQYGKMVVNWLSFPSRSTVTKDDLATALQTKTNSKTKNKKRKDFEASQEYQEKELELFEESDND